MAFSAAHRITSRRFSPVSPARRHSTRAAGRQFADNLQRFAAKAADEDLYISYVIVHPTIDRAKPAHQQAEPYLYAGAAAERDGGIVLRGAQMLGTGSVMSDYIFVSVILPLHPGDEDYAISCVVPNGAPGLKLYPRRPYALGRHQRIRLSAVEPFRRNRFAGRLRRCLCAVGRRFYLQKHRADRRPVQRDRGPCAWATRSRIFARGRSCSS